MEVSLELKIEAFDKEGTLTELPDKCVYEKKGKLTELPDKRVHEKKSKLIELPDECVHYRAPSVNKSRCKINEDVHNQTAVANESQDNPDESVVLVTYSDISSIQTASGVLGLTPTPSTSMSSILGSFAPTLKTMSSIHDLAAAANESQCKIVSNHELIAEFQRFSMGYQLNREAELRRECFSWMVLCVAIALLFYYRCEKILSGADCMNL